MSSPMMKRKLGFLPASAACEATAMSAAHNAAAALSRFPVIYFLSSFVNWTDDGQVDGGDAVSRSAAPFKRLSRSNPLTSNSHQAATWSCFPFILFPLLGL